MIDVGVGVSQEKNAVLAAEEALRLAERGKKSGKTDLAILFCSADLFPAPLLKFLNNSLEGCPIIGSSGPAIFTGDGVFNHGVALMLLGFPEGMYCTTSYIKDIRNDRILEAGQDIGEKLLYGFKNIPRSLGLLMFDRLIEDGQNFITGVQSHLGKSFPCVGSSASDATGSPKSSLFFNQSVLENACCGMLLGGKLNFGLGMAHGWKPLGKPHIVTAARGNVITMIDEQPAAKLYEEYLSCPLPQLKTDIKRYSVFYPIGVNIPGEEEYLLRNVIFADDYGALHCQGNVPEGSTIRVMISTTETCLDATENAVEGALRQLSSPVMKFHKEKASQFAVAFSSFSRYTLLRRNAFREIELVKKHLGANIPLIGLYTASELAPLHSQTYHGQLYFHNQAFSILLIEG